MLSCTHGNIVAGARCRGEGAQVAGTQQDSVLHDGGGGRGEAADGPGGGLQAVLGHAGGLHNHTPPPRRQGETLHREFRHAQSRRQGAGQGR